MLPMELLHARLSGLAPEPAPLPKGLDLLVQVLAGILIGLGFRKDLLRPDLLPLAALSALVFLGTALALGLPVSRLSRLTGLPLKTLLFALAPGGITGMGPLSQAEGGNPALVGVFHTVRVFLLFLLVPLLARLLP
jgi:membrane AbrB-like protein